MFRSYETQSSPAKAPVAVSDGGKQTWTTYDEPEEDAQNRAASSDFSNVSKQC